MIGIAEDDVSTPEPGNEPDIYLIDATITQFGDSGTREHSLSATRMTHFPLTDVTTLKVPHIYLFSDEKSGNAPWDIIASDGRLLPRSILNDEVVELWDQVLAIQEETDGDFIHIQTDNLMVFPDRDFAETDTYVSIDNQTSRTTAGGGMKAWLAEGRFQLSSSRTHRVVTVISPGQLRELDR